MLRTFQMPQLFKLNDIWPLHRAQGGGARPMYLSKSHTKFGWISSNGSGGDSMTEGQTDGLKRLQYPHQFLKQVWG